MTFEAVTPMHHTMTVVSSVAVAMRRPPRLTVVATLSKGYDLDYIWKQVDPSLERDAIGYDLRQARAGELPGRW
jgi:hypothetical protein